MHVVTFRPDLKKRVRPTTRLLEFGMMEWSTPLTQETWWVLLFRQRSTNQSRRHDSVCSECKRTQTHQHTRLPSTVLSNQMITTKNQYSDNSFYNWLLHATRTFEHIEFCCALDCRKIRPRMRFKTTYLFYLAYTIMSDLFSFCFCKYFNLLYDWWYK